MRTFKPNWDNDCCPVCNTKEDKDVALIRLYGTQDGNICEAVQVHVDCILSQLTYYKDNKIMALEIIV